MRNLIPHFIAEKFMDNQTSGNLMANTMFLDISGFSAMTERLMTEGKEGAEVLTEIINNVFEPVINAVYQSGGFIASFAGDAFTAIFPGLKSSAQVAVCSIEINRIFEKIGEQQTKFGVFKLFVKLGLSAGEVDWAIIGNGKQQTYYFKGEAIDGCANSEQHCNRSEIIFDENFKNNLPLNIRTPKLCFYNGFYRLINCEYESSAQLKIMQSDIANQVLNDFIPDLILSLEHLGEFREIVSVFISFTEPESATELNQLIIETINRCNQYGGYFNRTLFGDKGVTMLICFGMPVSYENNLTRALDFALFLTEKFGERIRIGLNSGIVYSGFIGSSLISEYTAYGDIVNQAARFMVKAGWGKIWTTGDLALKMAKLYTFNDLGKMQFKGKTEPIAIYELTGKAENSETAFFSGEMVGRQAELALLKDIAKPLSENKFSGIVTVYGEAGMGKSRLIYEFIKSHTELVEVPAEALFLQTDSVLKMSLNPFKYLLHNYFNQNKATSKEQKKANFEAVFNLLLKNLKNSSDERKFSIINELEKKKSILAAQIEVFYKNSINEQLDAKGLFENSLFVYKEFFKALSLLKPIIINIEDVHWLDEDSQTMIQILCRSVEDFPILIIATSRFNDDGSKTVLKVDREILQQEILLGNLDNESVINLINIHFDKRADSELIKFINDKAESNPFYIEQIIYYLKENNQLEYNSETTSLTKQNIKIPETINAIIIARVDRLESNHKSVVQLACVLGREVDLDLFYYMLKLYKSVFKRKDLNLILEDIENEQLWNKFREVKYIFKHALLHEAIYEMQLKSKLRDLHNLAALAIENVYPDEEERFFETAYHFDKAELFEKSVVYYNKAGNWLQKRFYNQEAIKCYDKVLDFLDEEKDAVLAITVLGNKGAILQLIGKWNEAEDIYQKALNISIKIDDKKNIINFLCNIAWIKSDKGDKNSAMQLYQQSLSMADNLDNYKKSLSKVYGHMGIVYKDQNNYTASMQCYRKQIEIAEEFGYKEDLALATANMANIYQDQGNYTEAMNCCKTSLKIFEDLNSKQNLSRVLGNMGNVFFYQTNYNKAMECYQENLLIADELGDKQNSSIAISNIGLIYRMQGNNTEAMKCYQKYLEVSQELGDKRGILQAIQNIGNIHIDLSDYDKAMECGQKQVRIAEEIGDRRGTAIGLCVIGSFYVENKNYAKAEEYYDRAICIVREVNLKYSLCEFLFLKAKLHYALKKYNNVQIFNNEALEIAKEIKRNDIVFNSTILSLKLTALTEAEEAALNLTKMLETETEEEYIATIHYEIYKINHSIEHQQKALAIYSELYATTPNIEYKNRIEELNNPADL